MKEMLQISSRKNEIVKDYIKLMESRAYRKERSLFTAEGARLCFDASQSGASIVNVFYTSKAKERYEKYLSPVIKCAENVYEITESVADVMSDVKSSQGIFCICKMGKMLEINLLEKNKKYIAGETIQDPSNMGAFFRTAEALGIDALVLSGDCCDVYSPKVLRGSMGAVFRMPVFILDDFADELKTLTKSGFETFAAVVDKNAKAITECDFTNGGIAVIGNEGNGLTKKAIEACKYAVTIPMNGRAESLNASAAAMIIMWEMCRK